MKKSLIPFLFAVSVSTSLAHASADLICTSYDVIEGWKSYPTHERVVFTARVESSTQLNDAIVSGAYDSDKRDLTADTNYTPRNPKYLAMNRFSVLEDAWAWFYPLLPKNFASLPLGKKFVGYMQILREGNQPTSFGMSCSLK